MAFRLYSDDLKDGAVLPQAQVFNSFGHSGGNQSPSVDRQRPSCNGVNSSNPPHSEPPR